MTVLCSRCACRPVAGIWASPAMLNLPSISHRYLIDISLDNPKGHFLQGDGGCAPSVDGLGTLYYSAPLLKLRAGARSAITIDARQISYHLLCNR